ncbi:MAG TPA: efflux RND transporter periplasmic adaptor subunit [Terriglobales bacterium]|jgi:membrane fusion protein (multidrug efflux system)|nr:efflux RND transporter periplasmic adaptor subunit [Terriglobales bacterium]
MPESPIANEPSSQAAADHALVLRMLYEEQTRLRSEIDELRKQQDEQSDQKDEKGSEAGDKEGGGEDKGEDKDDNDKEKGDDEDKDKAEKKPPLKERVQAWTRENPRGTVLIVIGFVLLLICAVLIWFYVESYQNTDDAFIDGRTAPLSARVTGFVTAVYVENTYRVKKGQLLVELDPHDFEVSKAQADANLAQAQAGLRAQTPNVPITETVQSTQVVNSELSVASATANLDASQERYQSAIADLHQAEASEANASQEAERYRLLAAKEEVSRELYDQRATDERSQAAMVASRKEMVRVAEKAVKQAEASLAQATQQARETKNNSPKQVAVQRETLAMREASVAAAQAQANQAALNLQYTKIYAPMDGVIGDKQVQVGSQVAPGQEMFALTQTEDIWITANFKETQVQKMRQGQSVTIHVDALDQKFEGYVEALPGASGAVYSLLPPENATGNYVKVVQRLPVRIRFKSGQPGIDRLAPGMSVEPKVWVR